MKRNEYVIRVAAAVLLVALLTTTWKPGDVPPEEGESGKYYARQEAVAVYEDAMGTYGDPETARVLAVRRYEEVLAAWNGV